METIKKLCPHCKTNFRHVTKTGNLASYCKSCKATRMKALYPHYKNRAMRISLIQLRWRAAKMRYAKRHDLPTL